MNIPERPRPLNVTDALSYLFGCLLPITLSGTFEVGGDVALQTLPECCLLLRLMNTKQQQAPRFQGINPSSTLSS